MPQTDLGNLDISDLATQVEDYSVSQEVTDGANESKETEYTNENWSKQFGYYKNIPELTSAIDAKATWTVGKGYIADEITTMQLDSIKGWGKDTFNTILENTIRTYHIGGDAFCEIILDKDDNLINLKPLDPSTIVIIADAKGRIKRYEQRSKINKKDVKRFEPHQIFHLARNRVADEIHGVSIIDAIEWIILARNEAMNDWKRVLHRNVDPIMIFHLDTDDTTKIASFKSKMDEARGKGENLYVPKDAVVPEQLATSINATLNPLAWIETLTKYFFQATGVPDIIVGGGASNSFTEASAKIAYLAFQQTIEEEQLFLEEQILAQLNLVIDLVFPADLSGEALSDKPKQEAQVEQPQIQKNEKAVENNDKIINLKGRK